MGPLTMQGWIHLLNMHRFSYFLLQLIHFYIGSHTIQISYIIYDHIHFLHRHYNNVNLNEPCRCGRDPLVVDFTINFLIFKLKFGQCPLLHYPLYVNKIHSYMILLNFFVFEYAQFYLFINIRETFAPITFKKGVC